MPDYIALLEVDPQWIGNLWSLKVVGPVQVASDGKILIPVQAPSAEYEGRIVNGFGSSAFIPTKVGLKGADKKEGG